VRLPPPLIELISKRLLRVLMEREVISSDHPHQTEEMLVRLITADLRIEDDITEEARQILIEHQDKLRGQEVEYHRLLSKVKGELAQKRGYVLGTASEGEKLPREKIHDLARQIRDAFLTDDDIEYYVPSEEKLRLAVFSALEREMRQDALRAEKARQKIRSMRRRIPEGTEEFQALFQQFYRELVDKGT